MIADDRGFRGHPSKTSSLKGGGVNQCGRGQGGPYIPDVHKCNFVCFSESESKPDSIPHDHVLWDRKIVCISDVYARYDPDVRGRGVQKVLFDRTSFMDDPSSIH